MKHSSLLHAMATLCLCASACGAAQPQDTPQATPPAAASNVIPDLRLEIDALRTRASQDNLLPLDTWCAERTLRSLAKKNALDRSPVPPETLSTWLAEAPTRVVRNGLLAVLDHRDARPPFALYWYFEHGHWRLDPLTTTPYADADLGPEHPLNRPLILAEATAGISGNGPLRTTIHTSMGDIHCTLTESLTPLTVANFVGLARGLRPFQDGRRAARPDLGTWNRRSFYDGLTFHRVIPGFMIQGGDPEGSGEGSPGYAVPDEFDPSLRFDDEGMLGMANDGPNTNGSQFFITEQATPWLNDRYSLFGRCRDIEVVKAIARVPKAPDNPSMPAEPVRILSISFTRG